MDICVCLKAHKNKLYHLGIRSYVNQSSLSRANERRDCRIFAEFGQYLIEQVRPMYVNCRIPNIDVENEVFALDSTTISLSLKLFSWAPRSEEHTSELKSLMRISYAVFC